MPHAMTRPPPLALLLVLGVRSSRALVLVGRGWVGDGVGCGIGGVAGGGLKQDGGM